MTETASEFLARWLPSTFLRGSAAFQVLGGIAAVSTDVVPFLPEALAANHLLVAAASMWPASPLLGPNRCRLDASAAARGEIALTFDDGPDPVTTPLVLDWLDRFEAKASFFLIAERAQRHPELTAEILARGHVIGNHSFHHRATFALQGVGSLRRELEAAQAVFAELTGQTPRYFRAPAGMRNPWLQPMLTLLDLELVTWSKRGFDGVSRNPETVLPRLVRNLRAGDILLLHDGAPTVGESRALLDSILPRLLQTVRDLGLESIALSPEIAPSR
jgi:peptidoglycan/xylan/chitin deacetylase (PgdA/CDA1 family)